MAFRNGQYLGSATITDVGTASIVSVQGARWWYVRPSGLGQWVQDTVRLAWSDVTVTVVCPE